jgi:hypothetical protein
MAEVDAGGLLLLVSLVTSQTIRGQRVSWMRWAAFCGSRSTRGKGHLHSNNNRLKADVAGFSRPRGFSRSRRVIASPGVGSDFAPPPVKRSVGPREEISDDDRERAKVYLSGMDSIVTQRALQNQPLAFGIII